MRNTTLTVLAISGILGLSGCNSTASHTISGKAIDPYLAGATVCLADDDQVCLSDEASVTTDDQGNYILTVSGDNFGESHNVVVSGGRDIETNTTFNGSVVAVHEANDTEVLDVTPLTTWLVAQYREANATTHALRNRVENDLEHRYGLNFHVDVVANAQEGNTTGLKVAVKLARSAELYDANHTFGFYVYVAHEANASSEHSVDETIHGAAEEAQSDATGSGLVEGVDDVIDAVNGAHDQTHSIAEAAHSAAHNAAKHIHGFVHDTVCSYTGTCGDDHNRSTHTPHTSH